MAFSRRRLFLYGSAMTAFPALPLRGEASEASSHAGFFSDAEESVDDPVCVTDFAPLAKKKIPSMGWEFMSAAAGDELSLRWNTEAYQRLRLKPRLMVDVSHVDTRTTLLGHEHAFPILLAPVACHKLYHPEGELATVRGASAAGAAMVLSTAANTSLEDVSKAAKTDLWFQLYAQRDEGFTRHLIARAEASGYRALCLTIDTPISGARNREMRAKVKFPPLPNLEGMKQSKGGDYMPSGLDIYSPMLNPTLTWKTIAWMRSFTKLPVLVKGVLNGEDASLAVEAGVSGIIVSNHGGRNLDTVPATIDALPFVADKVAGRVPVLVDGGIRRGTDVLKAIALGANAVLIGRPYVWGLGAQGEEGVAKVVNILRREFAMSMALTGRTTVASIDRSVLWA